MDTGYCWLLCADIDPVADLYEKGVNPPSRSTHDPHDDAFIVS